MKVVWLGPNLKHVITTLEEHYLKTKQVKSTVVLSWRPSDIIFPEKDFVSVTFKRCDHFHFNDVTECKYEMLRMEKFAWGKLEKYATMAYNTLRRMKFSDDDYDLLLKLYNSTELSYENVACEWLNLKNGDTNSWKSWITIPIGKSPLYIGGIFPISGFISTGQGITRAAQMAKNAINANSTILPDYSLNLLIADGQCRADKVMKAFIDYVVDANYYDKLVGVLGPACSDTVEPLAGVSKFYETAVVSYSAEGASFSDRKQYPYFFRTIGENTEYKYVYLQLLQKWNWKRVAALTEDGQKYTEYISHMRDLIEPHGISLIENVKFPRDERNSDMSSVSLLNTLRRSKLTKCFKYFTRSRNVISI